MSAPPSIRTAVRDDLHLFLGKCLNPINLRVKAQGLVLNALVNTFASIVSDRSDLSLFDICSQLLVSAFPLEPSVCHIRSNDIS